MNNYQKAYALLVGRIDEALTLMDSDDLMEFSRVQQILSDALEEAEEMFVGDENF